MSGSTIRMEALTASDVAAARARFPKAFGGSGKQRALRIGFWTAFVAYVAYLHWEFDFARIFTGLPRLWVIVRLMVDWSGFFEWDHAAILTAMVETLAMAFLGTLLAAAVALPLGFLGARNITVNRVIRFMFRRVFDTCRGLDQLVWALVFVRAVGLGPIAGVLAIFIADLGVLAKLYAEAIETAENGQIDGVRATGASPVAAIRFGVVPQVLPIMVSQALYQFESNTREATILGFVGAGGIGLRLSERIQINAWDQVAYIIVLILLTVAVLDALSARLRGGLIRAGAAHELNAVQST